MFNESLSLIQRFIPKFRAKPKKDMLLHRIIGVLLFFVPRYMSNFWTTIGYTAAYPPGGLNQWVTLLHEGKHGLQAKKFSRPLMGFLYLIPQPLALLALLFWVSPWFLLSLLFLAPWPAYWRMKWELEAYKVSIIVMQWTRGSVSNHYINYIAEENICGWNYYKAWWWKTRVWQELEKARWDAYYLRDVVKNDSYLMAILDMLMAEGKLHRDGILDIKPLETA